MCDVGSLISFSYLFVDLASMLCHVKMVSMNTPVIVFLGMKVSTVKLAKIPETAILVMVAVLEVLYSTLIEHCPGAEEICFEILQVSLTSLEFTSLTAMKN